jgi:hypothetical protein
VVPVAGVEEAAGRCEGVVVGAVGDAAEETVLGEVWVLVVGLEADS